MDDASDKLKQAQAESIRESTKRSEQLFEPNMLMRSGFAKGGAVNKAGYAKGGAVYNKEPSRFAKGR